MNSSAFGSRSRSRNGEGSMASNNCLNSPTCTSMTAHLVGIGSPADALLFERFVIAIQRVVYRLQISFSQQLPVELPSQRRHRHAVGHHLWPRTARSQHK